MVRQALTKAPLEPFSFAGPSFSHIRQSFLLPCFLGEGEGVSWFPLVKGLLSLSRDGLSHP